MGRGKWRGAARPPARATRTGTYVYARGTEWGQLPGFGESAQIGLGRFNALVGENVSRAGMMRRRNGIEQAVGHATRYSLAKQMCSRSAIAARVLGLLRQRAVRRHSVFTPEPNEPRKQ